MANYIIKNKITITVQENDNWVQEMYIDALLPFASNEFTFAVFTKTKEIFRKNNLPKDVVTISGESRNRLTITGVPIDTFGKANMDMIWELQRKTSNGEFFTIGQGKFIVKKTFITNL